VAGPVPAARPRWLFLLIGYRISPRAVAAWRRPYQRRAGLFRPLCQQPAGARPNRDLRRQAFEPRRAFSYRAGWQPDHVPQSRWALVARGRQVVGGSPPQTGRFAPA